MASEILRSAVSMNLVNDSNLIINIFDIFGLGIVGNLYINVSIKNKIAPILKFNKFVIQSIH